MHELTRGEKKSLAYHQIVAAKLRMNPALLLVARERLQWYRERNPAGRYYYDRWDALLSGSINQLIETITSASQESCALRQENPFVDLVSQRERAAIYRQVVEQLSVGETI